MMIEKINKMATRMLFNLVVGEEDMNDMLKDIVIYSIKEGLMDDEDRAEVNRQERLMRESKFGKHKKKKRRKKGIKEF